MQRVMIALAALTLSAACASEREGQRPEGMAEGPSREAQSQARNLELDGWADEFSDVKLEITSPTWNEVLSPGGVPVEFDLQNYEVWQGGAHVHLILDDEPYIPIYDVSKPFVLEDVAPGAHVLRAFPSRPWHESVKSSPEAFTVIRFVVGEDDGKYDIDPEGPILTYSRPKGEYEGKEAERIMFDFYLTNVELSEDGHRVSWKLDGGEEHFATEWKPIWWEDLAVGEHVVEIDLVDEEGAPVRNAELNFTSRKITVQR